MNPIPANEQQRLNALANVHIMDSLPEAAFDRLTELASIICDVPISIVSFIDAHRQWYKSRRGMDINEVPREISFCQFTIMGTDIYEVEDASTNDNFKDNPFVAGEGDVRFYAGCPLIDDLGHTLGTICVVDRIPRKLTEGQRRALTILAEEVMTLVRERRQQQELRHFEQLFLLSNDLVCIAGMDGYFKSVNPAFEHVLGWDKDYLLQTPYMELVHEDDLERTREELEQLQRGLTMSNFVQRFKVKDGTYKILQWVATPEPGTDNIFAIARDVTQERFREEQLHNSENRFRAFFENSQGLMCTHTLDGKFLSVNEAGAGSIGYTTEEITGKSLFDIIAEKYHPLLRAYLKEIATKEKANGLMYVCHKDGSPRTWLFNNILTYSMDGMPYVIGNSTDITERYLLETDLRRTKELLEQTNKVAHVGGWEVDLSQSKVYWSQVTREIHEAAEDFIPDMVSAIRFYKEGVSRDRITEAITACIEDGQTRDMELQIISAQGNEKWVRVIANVEYQNGAPVRLYGTFQDIDEKKKIELEVDASRKLLDDVLRSASEVSIIATDDTGIITVFNTGAEKLLGYTAAEMIGKETPWILHDPEEVKKRSDELSALYGEQIDLGLKTFVYRSEREGSDRNEWTYFRKDGSKRMVSLVMTTIRDVNGKINGYLGIATDITERKKIEKELSIERSRLSAFVEHAPAAVAMFDTDVRYIAFSKRWVEEYRLEGIDVTGLSHYDAFPNISQEWKDIHERCLGGKVEKNDEDRWRPPGWEQDQFLRWEVRPWYQYDGSVGGIMMFTQDITESCIQREELRKAKKQAELASIAKSEFLANMSHEIRTPLNGVIGFTDLVLRTRLNETQQQYISIVNQSANSLLGIINDILDFSKIESGKLELDTDKCDLYEISNDASDMITYQAQQKGLEVLLNITPDLPRFIWVDSVRLKQVLVNLLGNAVKFTEKGEIELKITRLEETKDTGDISLRFEVRDTGIGIRPEKQHKIFEAFLQEDISTTKKYGGTGLGLTISNSLLHLMGSRLQLMSTPGEGSVFFFDLNFKAEYGDPEVWEDIDKLERILIVDDNDNNRVIIRQMLLLKGIASDEARNGLEAIQLLACGVLYDVIIMDYHMPYMDGLETIRKIREGFEAQHGKQPVILLHSSSDDERIISSCEELKVNQRLVKPIKMQEMYNALSRLFRKPEQIEVIEEIAAPQVCRQSFRVLIAEDNSVNLLLAGTILKRVFPGVEVMEAINGKKAVEQFREQLPDLVLMDIQMPEMNGYEATAQIRQLPGGSKVPIIALTAANAMGEREKCLEAGMDDFMPKPFVEKEMLAMLEKWLPVAEPQEAQPEPAAVLDKEEHFCYSQVSGYLGSDESVIKEILLMAIGELRKSGAALQQFVAANNNTELNAAGHKLYGTSVTACFPRLAAYAARFEHSTVIDETIKQQLLPATLAEIETVIVLVKEKCEELPDA